MDENINMAKNIVLLLHGGNKIVENCDKNPTEPVLPVSHLWGWHARKARTLSWKNFLITETLFSKEFRSYKSLRKTFFEECPSL